LGVISLGIVTIEETSMYLVVSIKLLLLIEMRMTVEMSKINPIGIMLVETLEDGCIYQEVYFGSAICASYGNLIHKMNYKRMKRPDFQIFKKELSDYFNQLGYYEAEDIPQELPPKEVDSDGISF